MKAAQVLHSKSSLVEEAANELINMLLDLEALGKEEEQQFKGSSRNEQQTQVGENEGKKSELTNDIENN